MEPCGHSDASSHGLRLLGHDYAPRTRAFKAVLPLGFRVRLFFVFVGGVLAVQGPDLAPKPGHIFSTGVRSMAPHKHGEIESRHVQVWTCRVCMRTCLRVSESDVYSIQNPFP